jgi:chromosome segregation protein
MESAIGADRQALALLERERGEAREAVAVAAEDVERTTAARVAADAERDRLRADLLERERTRGGAASRLAELEREAQVAALEAQRLDDELVAIGRERDLAIESLPAPAEEDGSPVDEPDAALADVSATSLDEIQEELARVRRTLTQIGSVNPFAIDEHRELAGRLESLVAQDADLSAATASTGQLIGRLDAEIAEQFNAAFVAIGAKFDEFCQLLFAGGSASLQMNDEEGEAAGGIEIAVRPPGKRLQRLAMLSGGERALAGVALLFAMLSVNPVPFCILDEVDAALDEANIGRFADALRLLAKTIDFVVITHNRSTIETADTIYGVTMTDAAVSRLLSLRLADLPVEVAAG